MTTNDGVLIAMGLLLLGWWVGDGIRTRTRRQRVWRDERD